MGASWSGESWCRQARVRTRERKAHVDTMTGPLNHLLVSSPMPSMDYPGNAEARMLATASKRKLQRVRGAVAKLDALEPSTLSRNYERELVRAEEDVTKAHRELTSELEKLDGGDLLKRARMPHRPRTPG